ncbi:hypothetical protein MS3_00009639 [Schistosoma haematobium]|uniref:DUF7041 domain-containing protein n=2 Tax=Schistosoma haematobium TaxID=6185 RepID=A0A922IID8_SCHHA|nr:hypothetical protein MS3_00009639 [Schistosoma haematobium]KAH9579519.1 hypothetical protein MS3_00009639 [Schistosoma haematobium]
METTNIITNCTSDCLTVLYEFPCSDVHSQPRLDSTLQLVSQFLENVPTSGQISRRSQCDVQAIQFRPASFTSHDPEVWFAALEFQYETRCITSRRRKYAFALESLPEDHIVAVREVVLNSNAPNAYNCLKEAIFRHLLPSGEERLTTLLARHPLGDAKPSHHLTCLQSLAGPTAADSEIVKGLWLDSSPAHIQPYRNGPARGRTTSSGSPHSRPIFRED